jgi:hypothetical protein
MNRSLAVLMGALLILVGIGSVLAQEDDWPRTLPLKQGMVTIYRPQVDEMKDDIIHFRAALAYRETAGSEPVFGAGWFESKVEIDQSSRIVHPTNLKVIETRFPDGTDDLKTELSAVLAQQSPDWNLDFTLDELQASLKTAQAETAALQSLNTAPPRIIYRDRPALLISLDGEPILREIENSRYQAVINTPYPLIFDGSQYHLNVAKGVWYRASEATGPYQYEASPPVDIAAMVDADESAAAVEEPTEPVTADNAPEIVVTTEPAELIVTEGPAAFVPLVDDLLVLQNSEDDVFMHVSSQRFYIVLAGRWYQSDSLNGPWSYQPADELPTAFANIPRDSDQADSRVYVAGTEEAKDAVLDAQVPQTAAVERGEVDIEVEYDGEPVYQPVDGTDLVYIANTGSTVLVSDGLYYLVEDGVWYVSSSPNGPWEVATHRPAQVDTILPTSPVYNTRYVQVYDVTPRVVYVGYTPGYIGNYVYHNTIFYGTGWYYSPWVSPYYYYPRHSTWGFHVGYNSWSGWNFGLSWGWGPFSVSYFTGGYWHHPHYWHHHHYGWWGPRGYWPRRHHGRHYAHNRYGHRGGGRGDLYRDGRQRARVVHNGTEPVRASELRRKADIRDVNFKAGKKMLLADNSGKVYQKTSYRGSDKYGVATRKEPTNRTSKSQPAKAARQYGNGSEKSQRNTKGQSSNNKGAAGSKNDSRVSRKGRSATGSKNDSRVSSKSSGTAGSKNYNRLSSKSKGQSSEKTSAGRTKQPITFASAGTSQSRAVEKRSTQRSTPAGKPSARQTQSTKSGNSTPYRPSMAVKAPAQKQSKAQSVTQYKSQRNSGYNKPAQKQSRARSATQYKSQRNSSYNKPAPARQTSQRSTQKSSNQRKSSHSGGGKQSGGSRTKRN